MTRFQNHTRTVNQIETKNMDIPRYALIAASLLLGLMLLGEWTRFSEAQQAAALPATRLRPV